MEFSLLAAGGLADSWAVLLSRGEPFPAAALRGMSQALQPPGLTWPWSAKESDPREGPPGASALCEAGGGRAAPLMQPAVPLLSLHSPLKTHLEGWGAGVCRGRNRWLFPFPAGNLVHPLALGFPGGWASHRSGGGSRLVPPLLCPAGGPINCFPGHFVSVDFSLVVFFFFLFFFSVRGRKTKHFLQLEFFPLG